jgi:ElaB/YqjD/DUF883 family membrane-anchored ribosome-binding protein
VQRGVDRLEDVKDETARLVKRQPFKAVGVAVAVGVLVGGGVGWLGARLVQRQSAKC